MGSIVVQPRALGVRNALLALSLVAGLGWAWEAGATDLKVAGAWTAFNTKSTDGQNICGVKTMLSDSRQFYIKWFEGESVLTIQLFKDGWAIPPHVRPNVSMNFPGAKPWEAKGLDLDHEVANIEVSVPNAVVQPFARDITAATSGSVTFPGGHEPPWELTMAGFTPVLQVMVQCIDGVAGATSTTTPFAYMHGPQPGGGPKPPASPFGTRAVGDSGKLGQE